MLRALAVVSALGFLTLVMVQAISFYAPPPEAPKTRTDMLGPATKAAPVVSPPPPLEEPELDDRWDLLPATKAGHLGRLRRTVPRPPPPPPPQDAPFPPQ